MVAGAGVFLAGGGANLAMALLQGYGRFDLANLVLLTMTGAQGIGIGVVLVQGGELRPLVIVVAGASVLGCATGFSLLRIAVPEFRWATPAQARRHTGEALRFGGPMQVTNLLATIHVHVDKLLISHFVALASVASYELGSRVATMVSTLPQLVLLPVVPESAAMHAAGRTGPLRELYDRGNRFYLTLAALGTAAAIASADRVYSVWLGAPQPEASLVLRGLATAIGISLLTGMGTTIARGVGRTELEMWFAVCAVSLHLGLSAWWVPRLGIPGAIGAMLIGNFAGSLLFSWLFARLMGWPLLRVVLAPALWPALAATAGSVSGLLLDRALPRLHGLGGWACLMSVAAVSAVAVGLVIGGSGYLRWRELRPLLGRGG